VVRPEFYNCVCEKLGGQGELSVNSWGRFELKRKKTARKNGVGLNDPTMGVMVQNKRIVGGVG